MNSQCGLIDLVGQLIEAENENGKPGRAKAELILAENFTRITRARGEEQDREALLNEIENPRKPSLRRSLDDQERWEHCSGDLGVVRSVVSVTDSANARAKPARFRNTHVFERQGVKWVCVAWQTTELRAEGNVDRNLKALEWFKDWSNYLLVTTVAAAGWVASNQSIPWSQSQNVPWSQWLKAACIWSFGVSIIFGILTLALIPLIAQRINESHKSIYGVRADFSVFRLSGKAYLTQVCRPQHVSFMAGIVFYCLGTAGANWVVPFFVVLAALYGYFSRPKIRDES